MSSLTEKDVRVRASVQSVEKGRSYYKNGYVGDVVRRGNVVTAEVEGSEYEPYQVQITLNETSIADAVCTCPYDWGGDCKHIVAVLLTLVHKAEAVAEKEELSTLLAGLTEAQLRQVILNVAANQPEFVAALEREIEWLQASPATAVPGIAATSVDMAAIRREIHKDFRVAGNVGDRYDLYDFYGDEYGEVDAEEMLQPHLDKVKGLLDEGQVETAVAVMTAVIEAWIDGLAELDDWIYEANEDAFSEAADSLGGALAELLLSLELTPAVQAEWQKRIAHWKKALGEMEMAETAVQQGWDYPPLVAVLQGHISPKGMWEGEPPDFADELAQVRLRILERQERFQEYIHLAEVEGQLSLFINMLARTGQVDKAVSEAKAYLVYPSHILALAKVLMQQEHTAEALEIAEFGLSLAETPGKKELAQWLREQAETAGQPALALKAAQTAFAQSVTLADYQAVERLAGDDWSVIRLELLPVLVRGGYGNEAVDIYLYEGMLAEAMKKVGAQPQFYIYDGTMQKVVEATREKYPNWGIGKYQKLAEGIMNAGEAKNYETAVNWLRLAREIYLQHGRQADWHSYLNGLLETHQRKYKLVPMLREIR